MSEKIFKCRICDKEMKPKGLGLHLKSHGIKTRDYIKENIEDFKQFGWQLCLICGKMPKSRYKKTCSWKCGGEYKSKYHSKENHPWWGRKHTKESKEKMSESRKGKGGFPGDSNPSRRPEVAKKISDSHKKSGRFVGNKNPMYGKTHTEESLRKIFDKRSFTKPELIAKKILEENGFKVKPQFFLKEKNNTYSYDFKIEDYKIIIEIDGDYWHGGPGVNQHWFGVNETIQTDKMKDKVANKMGYEVIRIWESELNNNPSILIEKLNDRI